MIIVGPREFDLDDVIGSWSNGRARQVITASGDRIPLTPAQWAALKPLMGQGE